MPYLVIFLIFISSQLIAKDLDFDASFLEDLNEVSEIATKSKLNIDDSPSFVTILQSEKLIKLGIDNVFEALGLVPGVQLTKEASGVPIVVFRGVTQKGEVKLMVDGVTINNSYRGSIYYYFDFPIELVKRIEVIRGAGSVLYGSGAISGVVNIITKNSDKDSKNELFVSGGTYDNYKGGALISTDFKKIRISLDTYYQKNDKTILVKPNPSGYSGDSDRHLKDYSVGINISDEHFAFMGRIKKSEIGNAYGTSQVLDDKSDSFYNENSSIFSQISYRNSINQNNKINLIAGYNSYQQTAEDRYSGTNQLNTDYKENSYLYEINLISTSFTNNQLLVGAKFESSKTLTSKWSAIKPYISDPNASRDTTSIYFNDGYSFSKNLDISAGLRYDNYSDFGDSYAPNLGLVYRLTNKTKFKILYSHAFRAPSWIELTSNKNLNAETSRSIEAGVIFKYNHKNTLRVNIFKSHIKDMIVKDSTGKYVQNSKNDFVGSELEYIYIPSNKTELNLFASFIEAEDNNGDDLANVANILASSSLLYELNAEFTLGSLVKYVSNSHRAPTDTRDDMQESVIFDQTISYTHKNITASLVLKDLFDAGTHYALSSNNYAKDYDNGGRSFLLKASMEF